MYVNLTNSRASIPTPFLFLDPRDGEYSVATDEGLQSDLVAIDHSDHRVRHLGEKAYRLNTHETV